MPFVTVSSIGGGRWKCIGMLESLPFTIEIRVSVQTRMCIVHSIFYAPRCQNSLRWMSAGVL